MLLGPRVSEPSCFEAAPAKIIFNTCTDIYSFYFISFSRKYIKTGMYRTIYTICVNYKAKIEAGARAGAGPKWQLRLQPKTLAPGGSCSETLLGQKRKEIFFYNRPTVGRIGTVNNVSSSVRGGIISSTIVIANKFESAGVYVLQDNSFRFLSRATADRQYLEASPKECPPPSYPEPAVLKIWFGLFCQTWNLLN